MSVWRRFTVLLLIACAGLISGVAQAAPATAPGVAGALANLTRVGGKLGSGQGAVAESIVPFHASGALTVTFRGDRAAGCARQGVCAYRGTVSWSAAPGGDLALIRFRDGSRVRAEAVEVPGTDSSLTQPAVAAEVDRTLPGGAIARCADTADSANGFGASIVRRESALRVQLLTRSTDLLSTRCAGPIDAVLASSSPAATIAIARIARGRQLDLSRRRTFSAGGFTGTIDSTVVLRLGRPRTEKNLGLSPLLLGLLGLPPGPIRTVTEPLRLTGATGTITAHVSGDTDRLVCSLLDACGLAGSVALTPRPAPVTGDLIVFGSAKQPEAPYLAALGLGPGPTDGLFAEGSLAWNDHGLARLSDAQDGQHCSDAIPLDGGSVGLEVIGARIEANYTPVSLLHGECPGPELGNDELASGSVPLSALHGASFALRLRPTGAITDDGYQVSLSGSVTLQLSVGKLSDVVTAEP
jgi:hypothetical protein